MTDSEQGQSDPYASPPGGQPAPASPYGQPQGAQPPYGQPLYGEPPYGEPLYGEPQYGEPLYGEPRYGEPQYGQPQWGGAPGGAHGALASWPHRVGGRLIDTVVVFVPAAVIGVASGSRAVYQVLGIIGTVVIAYLNGAQGQSPGKRAVGLRLVRESDGQLIGGGMGIVREIAHILDSLACLVGWLWPLWDKKRQTFADKICGTVVVKT